MEDETRVAVQGYIRLELPLRLALDEGELRGDRQVDDGLKYRRLAGEVVEQGGLPEARRLGDLPGGGGGETLGPEQLPGGIENGLVRWQPVLCRPGPGAADPTAAFFGR